MLLNLRARMLVYAAPEQGYGRRSLNSIHIAAGISYFGNVSCRQPLPKRQETRRHLNRGKKKDREPCSAYFRTS
jgi:hypothetical protein